MIYEFLVANEFVDFFKSIRIKLFFYVSKHFFSKFWKIKEHTNITYFEYVFMAD